MDMLTKHMAARGLAAGDTGALLFTAPGGGVLRYSNWLRRCWWPATIAAGLGTMVEDEATGKPSTSASASTTSAGRTRRVWWRRAST
jgi:hypothetical protein